MPVTRRSQSRKVADIAAVPATLEGETICSDPLVMSKNPVINKKSATCDAKQERVGEDISSKLDETEEPTRLKRTVKSSSLPLSSDQKTIRKGQKTVHAETEKKAGFKLSDLGQDVAVHAADKCQSVSANARKRKPNIEPPAVTQKRSRGRKKTGENEDGADISDTKVSTSQDDLVSKPGKLNVKEQTQKKKQHDREKSQITEKNQAQSSSTPQGWANKQMAIEVKKEASTSDEAVKLKGTVETSSARNSGMDSLMVVTEEGSSDSDSDFEEVPSRFRTPESFYLSSAHSDSGICRKLENSFSDFESSPNPSDSFTSIGSSSLSSPSYSAAKLDSRDSNTNRAQSEVSSSGSKMSAEKKPAKKARKQSNERENQGRKKRQVNSEKMLDKSKPGAPASPKKERNTETGEMDIMAMLMQMEGQPVKAHQAVNENKPSTSRSGCKNTKLPANMDDSDGSEESEWEEVEDSRHSPMKSQIPDAPVQITIDDPSMMRKKRKKKEFDWQAYVQRRIKRLAREIQVDMHKVNLLCLLSHSMQQNSICNDMTLRATALSIVPAEQLRRSMTRFDSASLLVVVKWFRSSFCLAKISTEDASSLASSSQLTDVIRDYEANEPRLLVMVLIALLRAMGLNVRLVVSLQPVSLKICVAAINKAAPKRKKGDNAEATGSSSKKPTQAAGNQKTTKTSSARATQPKSQASKYFSQNTKQAKAAERPEEKTERTSKKTTTRGGDASSSEDGDDEDMDGPSRPKRRLSVRPRKSFEPSSSSKGNEADLDDESGDDDRPSSASDASNFSEEEEVVRKKLKQSSKGKRKTSSKQSSKRKVAEDEKSDSEFDHSFKVKSLTVKEREQQKKASGKVQSTDSGPEGSTERRGKSGRDCWLEVFLPAESKWVCVDCVRSTIGKPYDIGAAASQPLLYVLGFENDGSIKDITAKYAPQWLSHTRKQRVDSDWWRESLQPYASTNEELDDHENESIKAHLMQRPLPTSIGDYKNHPLYALQRHLLKFEAIYPESSIPVGYIRQEPVYARDCVHTLHSRDNWLKEARVVRLGETAYKRVKSRKQWRRVSDNPEELDLELFGRWQTEEYIPPPAVNGKVPKNEYGNVELFQPSMLPGGTVHLRVPALNRVAKKLGIDVVAAMTGWDHHCGFSHPVLDGWIVCEEHKEILLAAWEEDQEIQKQRENERREKRVLNNWTTLVRGLLIKERLKKKFNLEEKDAAPKVKKEVKAKKGEVATDLQHAWPARQQQKEKTKKEKPPPQPSHYSVETM